MSLGGTSVDVKVPAFDCDDCGKTYPVKEYVDALFAPLDAETAPV